MMKGRRILLHLHIDALNRAGGPRKLRVTSIDVIVAHPCWVVPRGEKEV